MPEGFPRRHRAKLYFQLLACPTLLTNLRSQFNTHDLFSFFSKPLQRAPAHLLDLIDSDISNLQLESGPEKLRIKRVLHAYAAYLAQTNPSRQSRLIYHRGLLWVVYRLLQLASEPLAFKLLLALA